MNQNEGKQSEARHSPEPWKLHIGGIYDAEGNSVLSSLSQITENNAARIVECVNFCAGVHIETLTLLNQANHPTLQQICEENQTLRAENERLSNLANAQANQMMNIADTCRVRGFEGGLGNPLDQRVIDMIQASEKENNRLRGENQVLIAVRNEFRECAIEQTTKLVSTERELQSAQAKLRKYGRHLDTCEAVKFAKLDKDCTCGWGDIELECDLASRSEAEIRLTSLLCRIHRDGGHYIAQHGEEKAFIDAEEKIMEAIHFNDAAQAKLKAMECPKCGGEGHYSDQSSDGENTICDCQHPNTLADEALEIFKELNEYGIQLPFTVRNKINNLISKLP